MKKDNQKMNKTKSSEELHQNVPPNWYFDSIKKNTLQRFWHLWRFDEIGRLITPVSGTVLDIGTADGVFSNVVFKKTKAKRLIGIDVLKSSVDWANEHWRKTPMCFMVGSAENLKFKNGTFEAVFALEMLEHVYDPVKVLNEIKRVMKKGGYGVFLVPTDSWLFRVIWWVWLKFRGKIWRETHLQTYRNNHLPKICKNVGFEVVVNKKFILGMLQAVKVKKR